MSFRASIGGGASIGARLCVSAVRTIRDAGVHMHTAGYRSDYRLTDIHMSGM